MGCLFELLLLTATWGIAHAIDAERTGLLLQFFLGGYFVSVFTSALTSKGG